MATSNRWKIIPRVSLSQFSRDILSVKKIIRNPCSAFHSISILGNQYQNDKFIIGVDTEKILEAGFTGLNTRAGDLMVLKGKYANSNSSTTWANSVYIILHTDQILEIRDTGSQVFD